MSKSPFLSSCTADSIREAAAALKAGHLVAFPTETVYGLGADARNPDAVRRIYEVKGRPSDHPLIVHISSIKQLEKWAINIPDYAFALARIFWPGPLTLILNRTEIAKNFITGEQETVGLRVPSDPIAAALIHEFERISDSAIAAPSANRFGQLSPTTAFAVEQELQQFFSPGDRILDGGNSSLGIESTIVDCTSSLPRILRPGSITAELIVEHLSIPLSQEEKLKAIRFSGSFEKHYAPRASVLLNVIPVSGDGFIALAGFETPKGVRRLASPKNLEEFAQTLYSSLRDADRLRLTRVVVLLPENKGIGAAIVDRLTKASNGR
jgi:L-threonylcarbamoyladenylate synthase